ncbi:MAG: SpoIID/LytB domain-containing protein [Phycisphaerales bacterium]
MRSIPSVFARARALPRSTVAMGALAAALLAAAALVSCQTAARRGPDAFEPTVAFGAEPDIRVRVLSGVDGVEIGGPPRILARSMLGGERHELTTPVRLHAVAGALRLQSASGDAANFLEPATIRIDALGGGLMTLDASPYPGSFEARARSDVAPDAIDLLAIMPMETYLPGVLVKELYPSWPLECYEAQAVCARSYAMHERARARSLGRWFDVEGTVVDQAFSGATEHATANAAAEATRGQVITYDGGRLLRAYYASTCAGRPGSAADTWPTGPGYAFNLAEPLQAHPRDHYCQKSPLYRWERVRGRERLSLRIRRWGQENGHPVKTIGQLAGVEVERRNAAGRPARFMLRDDAARSFSMSAEELRLACNTPVPGVPDLTRDESVRSSDIEVTVEGDKVKIAGRGFGHGVGMCQFGAAALAEKGWTHREIIALYYPNTNIQRAY